MRPANGSAIVFQTNAAAGAFSSAVRATSRAGLVDALERPLGRRRQVGDDRVEQLAERRCSAAPTCRPAGTSSPAIVALRRPATSSSSVSVPASKNFSISFSSASATISISASRALSTAAAMSAGIAPSVNLPLSSVWKMNAFFVTRSTTPLNALLLADRQLNRDDRAVARLRAATASERVEAGALAIEPVEHDQPRQPELARRPPTPFRSAPSRRRPRRRRRARHRRRAAPRARRSGSCRCPACRSG